MIKILNYTGTQQKLNIMLFVAFDEVERSQQQKYSTFSSKLTFAFKALFVISFGFLLYNQITLNGFVFADIPSRTFHLTQFWRVFTAPFSTLEGLYGVLSVLVSFWWLLSLFPGYERKYSSIHLLLEIFLQNFLVQITYCIVVTLLITNTYFYETYNDYFFSLGWIPMVIIWVFKFTGQNKEDKVNFCFLPFLVKNKYLPWIVSIVFIVLTIQKTPLIVATLLGGIQFHLFQRSCIRFPLWFHICLQKPFLLCSRFFPSFVKIESVRSNLAKLCGQKQQEMLNENSPEFPGEKQKLDFFASHDSNDKQLASINMKKQESEFELVNQERKSKGEQKPDLT